MRSRHPGVAALWAQDPAPTLHRVRTDRVMSSDLTIDTALCVLSPRPPGG